MKKTLVVMLLASISIVVSAQAPPAGEFYCGMAKRMAHSLGFKESSVGINYNLTYYKLEWEIDPNIKYIKGAVTSYFSITANSVKTIDFDLNTALKVDSVVYHSKKVTFTHTNHILNINLPNTLNSAQSDSVKVYYHGTPVEDGFGSFIKSNHNGDPIIWTLSEPYGAHDWWPCKESLSDKIDSIDIFVKHPQNYRAASNGVLVSEINVGNMRLAHWKHRHPIATYLIAIAVTNYAVYSDYLITDGDTIEVLNYVFPEDLAEAKASTPKVLPVIDLYNRLFIPYPFKNEKYGHAQFGWGGGMEHQTMSFMGGFSVSLMAHELAHQWFGDYITCANWHDIWINEGFATYLEGMSVEHKLSNNTWENWKYEKIRLITNSPDGSVYVDDTTSVQRIFDYRLTYSKAAMVMHMLRCELGDSMFFTAIKNYLHDPKLVNSFAGTADLKAHFETVYGKSLTNFFNDWYYGQGFPIYQLIWKQDDNKKLTVTAHQSQAHNSVSFFEMHIPVKFIGEGRDTLIRFDNTVNDEAFQVQLNFDVERAVFDPNNDLVTRDSEILYIDNAVDNDRFAIIPNPAGDQITIKFGQTVKVSDIYIYDISGKRHKRFRENQNSHIFKYDIADLPTGTYFVKIKVNNNQVVEKFIKE